MSEHPALKRRTAREPEDTQRLERLQDHAAALQSIRAARSVFLLVLVLSLLAHAGAYAAARWGGVLEPLPAIQEQLSQPADAAGVVPDAETAARFSTWFYLLELVLPLAAFLGALSCGLLTVSYLFATLVCLSGGLGGVRGSISAFFWMLVLLALLFPWGRWLGTDPDVIQIPGVYCTFADLNGLPGAFRDRIHEVIHNARYLGYPLLALLIAFTGNRRFAQGYRRVRRHVESQLNVRSI